MPLPWRSTRIPVHDSAAALKIHLDRLCRDLHLLEERLISICLIALDASCLGWVGYYS